jgi:hypothetical protein
MSAVDQSAVETVIVASAAGSPLEKGVAVLTFRREESSFRTHYSVHHSCASNATALLIIHALFYSRLFISKCGVFDSELNTSERSCINYFGKHTSWSQPNFGITTDHRVKQMQGHLVLSLRGCYRLDTSV